MRISDWSSDVCSSDLWIGHSVGAQILPLVNGHERLTRIVTIAAGSGYWRENSPQIRNKAWLLWHGLAPVLTAVAGYFPGGRIGAVGDLPAAIGRASCRERVVE